MKTRFITPDENNAILDGSVDLRHTVLREDSVVDEFYSETMSNIDGSDSVSFSDPIYILFNQQRLNRLGTSAVQAFFDSLQPKSDSLRELRSKCSDDDLMAMMKSRHLQSPAEILAWCRYMESNVDHFNSEVKAIIEAQSKTAETEQTSEQTNSE